MSADLTSPPGEVTAPEGLPAEQPRRRLRPGLMLSLHLATLLFGAVVLLVVNRRDWFYADEWAFILGRDLSHDTWRMLMVPHNEHWSTLPILLWRALLAGFGLRTYLPYAVALVLLHLGVTHVLWRLLLRVGTSRWVALTLAAAFAVLGAGWQNLTWAFQYGFIASVLFGGLAVWAADGPRLGLGRIAGIWLAAVAALMSSGMGLVMLTVVGLLALLRAGWRAALTAVSVPVLVFGAWYLSYGRITQVGQDHSRSRFLAIPEYVATGLTSSLTSFVGLPAAGAVLVLGLAWWLANRWSLVRGPQALAFAGAAGSVAMFCLIATGRVSLGIGQAAASRYAYVCLALLLPALGLGLTELLATAPRFAVLPVALFLVTHNVYLLDHNGGMVAGAMQQGRSLILAAGQLAVSGEPILRQQPVPSPDPDIGMAGLRKLRERGWLPAPSKPLASAELAVRAQTQVALLPAGQSSTLPALTVGASAELRASAAPGGCTSYLPTGPVPRLELDVPAQQGGRILIRAATPGLKVALRAADGGRTGAPVVLPDTPGATQELDVVALGHVAVLAPTGGLPITVCPAG